MGKYFKEYNNQRLSKTSNLDIEALAEKVIRTAAPIPPVVKQMAGKLWNISNPLWKKIIKPTTLQSRSQGLIPGELGYSAATTGDRAIQPGKAPGAYAAGSFFPGAQGVSKFLNKIPGVGSTVAKIISNVDLITSGEKHLPEVARLLGQRYRVTDLNGPNQAPYDVNLTLKQILDGLDSNGVVAIGQRQLEFSSSNIIAILADMKKLDEYAIKWAKIKTIAGALGIGIPAAIIEYQSRTDPNRVKRREKSEEAGKKAGQKASGGYKTPEQDKADVEQAKRDLGLL
jgi:hypothetical protein